MAIINRMTRLFRADMHAVLDRIEEPEVLLRQSLREMEEDLAGDEQRCKRLERDIALVDTRREELDQALTKLASELDLCFEAGKEDLAKTLVRRRLELQRQDKLLARKRSDLETSASALKTRIEHNAARLAAMRQKAELLAGEIGTERDETWITTDFTVSDADVELALLRERQQRSRP